MRLEDPVQMLTLPRKLVSIPYWCDWKVRIDGFVLHRIEFQFLIGAIGRNRSAGRVSGDAVFQFLIGAIGRSNEIVGTNLRPKFQFLIGAIGRKPCFALNVLFAPFQFLIGAIGR